MKRSFGYKLLLKAFRLLPTKNNMTVPAAKAQRIFKKAYGSRKRISDRSGRNGEVA